MKITENVYMLDCTAFSHAYAVTGENGITLIDTCVLGKGAEILTELKTYGIDPSDIKRILITHHDIDHIGNAAFLQEQCGCEVMISKTDLPCVTGEQKRDGFKKVLGLFMKADVPKDIKAFTSERIDEISVIPTPGHTRGHCCLRFDNVLFAGDLISTKNGKVTLPPAIMTWKPKELCESCKKLDMNGVDFICPAHGDPVKADAWSVFLLNL